MMANIQLVLLSVGASLGFGILFHIVGWNLVLAALGGGLTRIAFLCFMQVTDQRVVYTLLAALVAALYAEFLATKKKMPSTIFLYPSIIPLIPADLLYNAMMGLLTGDAELLTINAMNCGLALTGMCVGFVVSSSVAYYVRKYHLGLRKVERLLAASRKK